MRDRRDGKQCDDCCDKGQKLKHGFKIKFFGETHDEFWPCANGLISFKGEVDAYTPIKFPIADQPVVAAFWGDVDLRTCRPELGMRCSYFKVFYGEEAGFLNYKITQQYMTWPQTFKAKVAIVQTWDRVGYYSRRTNKENTFQLVIVSDGFDNTFAGMYYDKIEWTTGDESGGENGLGGTPAQMGFDDGQRKKFFAHRWSRTPNVLKLANKEFIYAISTLKICPVGQALVGSNCVPRSCSRQKTFPILDIKGQKRVLDDGTKNLDYIQPPVVAGGCAVYEGDLSKKVDHGTKCFLKCEYDANTGRFAQPKDLGTVEQTNEGIVAKCDAANWVENAAQNCVEVGIEATVSNAAADGSFEVSESVSEKAQTMRVSLKSKPYTTGAVAVELRTSCKNGKALQSRAQGNDKKFFCKDDPDDADKETDPLAAFLIGGRSYYVTTLLFTASNWNTPQKVEIKGVDNHAKSLDGFETFKVSLGIHSVDNEDCNSVGCSTQTPYTLLKPISINGKLKDNEVLEIKEIKDLRSLISDENGAEATFFLSAVNEGNKQYVGEKLSCKSSNQKEGKLVAFSLGDVQEYLKDTSDSSQLGEKKPLQDGDVITLTEKDVIFYVAGQPDDIVDGPQKYQMTCALANKDLGAILPLELTNKDTNTPGVIVTTPSYAKGECSADKVVDGCGRLQTKQGGAGTSFNVKLATRPHKDVIILVEAKTKTEKGQKNTVLITPSFHKFTPADWNVAKPFRVEGAGADILDNLFTDDGDILEQLSITVDGSGTQDNGHSILHRGEKPEYEHVHGYASCGAAPLPVPEGTTPQPAFKVLDDDELERMRRQTPLKCFSYDSSKITGKRGDKVPDENNLKFGVNIKRDTAGAIAIKTTTGVITGIVAAIIITLIVLAIVGALVAMAIRRKRGEEADRKADVKKGADRAEADISFRMNEMENGRGIADLDDTISRLKGERDRLQEENRNLAAAVGEEPMLCADTKDSDALVEQIKGLKTENDRLREIQSTDNSKRTNRRKKKKADGFGQQRESK